MLSLRDGVLYALVATCRESERARTFCEGLMGFAKQEHEDMISLQLTRLIEQHHAS
jgi:hypothetical protein